MSATILNNGSDAQEKETVKPNRKISDLGSTGKTNLSFVPEEDEEDESQLQSNNGQSAKTNDPQIPFGSAKNNARRHTTHSLDFRRGSDAQGQGQNGTGSKNGNGNNNRGSVHSVELRRQSKAFKKKFSRAWSQLSFHPTQSQQEPQYELQGIGLEVRKYL